MATLVCVCVAKMFGSQCSHVHNTILFFRKIIFTNPAFASSWRLPSRRQPASRSPWVQESLSPWVGGWPLLYRLYGLYSLHCTLMAPSSSQFMAGVNRSLFSAPARHCSPSSHRTFGIIHKNEQRWWTLNNTQYKTSSASIKLMMYLYLYLLFIS